MILKQILQKKLYSEIDLFIKKDKCSFFLLNKIVHITEKSVKSTTQNRQESGFFPLKSPTLRRMISVM